QRGSLGRGRWWDWVAVRLVCCFFFFSSRRRHTRSDRDWSSDVCSSDLLFGVRTAAHLLAAFRAVAERGEWAGELEVTHREGQTRSEERRVGKECRYRWAPYP